MQLRTIIYTLSILMLVQNAYSQTEVFPSSQWIPRDAAYNVELSRRFNEAIEMRVTIEDGVVPLHEPPVVMVYATRNGFDAVRSYFESKGLTMTEFDREKTKIAQEKSLKNPVSYDKRIFPPIENLSYRRASSRTPDGWFITLESHRRDLKTGEWVLGTTIRYSKIIEAKGSDPSNDPSVHQGM